MAYSSGLLPSVALLAEGVDRNIVFNILTPPTTTSLSSRRAWIEIYLEETKLENIIVALLAEGVDRNPDLFGSQHDVLVALLAEGVDRNKNLLTKEDNCGSRSPRGGRG